jgi:hypothetical protein
MDPAVARLLTRGASLARSLYRSGREGQETRELMRAALCRALCPAAPDSGGTRILATRIEQRLWNEDVAPSRGRIERVTYAMHQRWREAFRVLDRRRIKWLHWREEMSAWIHASVGDDEIRKLRRTECPEGPRTAAQFSTDFPISLLDELACPERYSDFRDGLLRQLSETDRLRRERGLSVGQRGSRH